MAVKNRGLAEELGEFANHYDVEAIQRGTAKWNPTSPVFSGWVPAVDTADTGERSGIAQSLWGGEQSSLDADALRSVGSIAADEDTLGVLQPVPLPKLTKSAKRYANLMGSGMPEDGVHSVAERRKYESEIQQYYFQPGDSRGRQSELSRIDWDRWALRWNDFCSEMEDGTRPWEAINRKTSRQLQAYHERWKQRANTVLTMQPIRGEHQLLRADLQQPAEAAAFSHSIGHVRAAPVPTLRVSQLETQATTNAASFLTNDNDAGMLGLNGSAPEMHLSSPTTVNTPSSAGQSKLVQERGQSSLQNGKQRRSPRQCTICGHFRHLGKFGKLHDPPRRATSGGASCRVPTSERRPDDERTGRSDGNLVRRFSPCTCRDCIAGLHAQENG